VLVVDGGGGEGKGAGQEEREDPPPKTFELDPQLKLFPA
jgi:hypothetical protein